jgi:uncharacterized membrane protein
MSYPCWKIFSIVGLFITLIGLIFLFCARVYGKFSNVHKPPTRFKRFIGNVGWILTVFGYNKDNSY